MESFDQLSRQYTPMIYKIIHSLHIYKNIDEFYHHGLIALWEASKRFDASKGSFTNFAYNYIKGFLLTELRKANQYGERYINPSEEYWENVEDFLPEVPLEEEIILTYCGNLTENQKKWVLYTALRDLSIKEIADIEHVSVSAVKSWRAGARERIKSQHPVH